MKIWTGKYCLVLALALGGLPICGCSSSNEKKGAPPGEVPHEVSLKEDRAAVEQLRKEIPEEIKKSNDRLAETLNRWKAQKMPPDRLRDKFNDEIRKMRNAMDTKQKKGREDFQQNLAEKRRNFLDKLKESRDSFYASKPTSQQRSDFSSRQQSERDRYFGDERDARSEFDASIKDERKDFEDDIASRWTEFRQEFPEYSRLWKEMKEREDKQHEENLKNPKPSGTVWPYKFSGEENTSDKPQGTGEVPPKAENVDVNKGGNGWPSSDTSEFDQIPGKKSGH